MAAASTSKYRSPIFVHDMLDSEDANIFMYFVHATLETEPATVPKNNVVIQTGAGASFACTLDTSSDPEILERFLRDRTHTFDILMGAVEQITILNLFSYKVEDESTLEKKIGLTYSDLKKAEDTGQKWGVYLIDQTMNKLVFHDDLTEYLIEESTFHDGILQSKMIQHANSVLDDKPTNIHVFVNCASVPKSLNLGGLSKLHIPTAATVTTRSITRHVEPNKKNYTRNNIASLKEFRDDMVKRITVALAERLKSAYSFDSATMREKKSVIHAKAAELYDALLEQDDFQGLVKESLKTKKDTAKKGFLQASLPAIGQLVYEDISWFTDATGSTGEEGPRVGGGGAKKTRRTRKTRKRPSRK
jgi:hypothetical protein